MNVRTIGTFLVAAAMIGLGQVMQTGCPTREHELQRSPFQCTALGYYRTKANFFAPNATAIEEFGQKILQVWDTSPYELSKKYEIKFPLNETGCLKESETRSLYKKINALIPSFINKTSDPLGQAYIASETRRKARVETRTLMCDQNQVEILEERDRAEYGTARPNFAYMIGKYAQAAIESCKAKACDIKNATCSAIIGSAQKTNSFFTWISKTFF